MRRADRCVTDIDEQKRILSECSVCRLGMVDGDRPYVVPLNFGYIWEDALPVVYVHCAVEGRKLDILARNPNVCFQADCNHLLQGDDTGSDACTYTYRYGSIIADGTARVVEDAGERATALDAIMLHMTGRGGWEYGEGALARIAILRIDLTALSCKENKPKP